MRTVVSYASSRFRFSCQVATGDSRVPGVMQNLEAREARRTPAVGALPT